jgi:hypothetical protein
MMTHRSGMSRRKRLESLGAILLLFLLLGRWQRSWYDVYAGGLIALTGLAWSRAGEWLAMYWMKGARAIGWMTGRVLLTVIFFVVVLPVSFFVKRNDKLDIRRKRGRRTMFKDRDHTFVGRDLKDPW